MSKSDLKEKSKLFQNKDDYFVINKKQLVDNFFIGFLLLGLIVFLYLLGNGIYGSITGVNQELNPNLISYFSDDYLNITYPVPGGEWGQGELDKSNLSEIISASSGSDGLFSITDDVLTEEVISSIYFMDAGDEGYRQFMSFSFKPVQNTVTSEDFLDYCLDSFTRDIENSGSYIDFEITDSYVDDLGGALMHGILTEEMSTDDGVSTPVKSYYTQYIKPLGKNIGTVTYGSLIEDTTADEYMRYYLNNIVDVNGEVINSNTSTSSSMNENSSEVDFDEIIIEDEDSSINSVVNTDSSTANTESVE